MKTREAKVTMPDTITIQVASIPIAQPRQRHRVVVGKTGKAYATNYTPTRDPVNVYKASVQQAAQNQYQGSPLDGPLAVRLRFLLPRPKSLCWKKKPMPRRWHTRKPDAENMAKSTLDALSGLLWRDDAQVCSLWAEKLYASGAEQPGVIVQVNALEASGESDLLWA